MPRCSAAAVLLALAASAGAGAAETADTPAAAAGGGTCVAGDTCADSAPAAGESTKAGGKPLDTLLRVYENVADDALLRAVTDEAVRLAQLGEDQGKAVTLWFPKALWEAPADDEYALQHLVRRLYAAEGRHPNVAGAELWVHHRGLRWKQGGPHFDKDEVGFKQQSAAMAFPMRSSVTYLSDHGGPTIIFNQSMSEDLSARSPDIPAQAAVSWPQTNKHVTFRGSCYHQVRGDRVFNLTIPEGAALQRLTLLVNWWDHKVPGETFSAAWAAERGLNPPAAPVPPHAPLREVGAPTHVYGVDPAADAAAESAMLTTPLFPTTSGRRGERQFKYAVPTVGPCRETCVLDWTQSPTSALAYPSLLDMRNMYVTKEAIQDVGTRLASLVYVDHADWLLEPYEGVNMAKALQKVERVFQKKGARRVTTYVTDAFSSTPFLSVMRLDPLGLPALVVVTPRSNFVLNDVNNLFKSQNETESVMLRAVAQAVNVKLPKKKGLTDFIEDNAGPLRLYQSNMGNPFFPPFDVSYLAHPATRVPSYASLLGKCEGRAFERAMQTSRGGKTVCLVYLPDPAVPVENGMAPEVPGAFEDAWHIVWSERESMTNMSKTSWEFFHAADPESIAEVAQGLRTMAEAAHTAFPEKLPALVAYEAEDRTIRPIAGHADAGLKVEDYLQWMMDAVGIGTTPADHPELRAPRST